MKLTHEKKLSKKLVIVLAAVLSAAAVIVAYKAWYWYKNDYDKYENDYFVGQTPGGVCTHDLSYEEPVIPDGRYYPEGDSSAAYYLEITENKYLKLAPASGELSDMLVILYENNALNLSEYLEKTEFKVITSHVADAPFLYKEWKDFVPVHEETYTGEKYEGVKSLFPVSVRCDENGNISLPDPVNKYHTYLFLEKS